MRARIVFQLANDGVQWRNFVNTVMNHQDS